MTQPANGEWYLATDGKWYCWPDPTPHDEPPAVPPAPPAPPAPPTVPLVAPIPPAAPAAAPTPQAAPFAPADPAPPVPPAFDPAPFGAPGGAAGSPGYGAPAVPGNAPGSPGFGSPTPGYGPPAGYQTTGALGYTTAADADPKFAYLAVVGGALCVLGSFMPWVKLQTGLLSISRSGMDGDDGAITLVLGLAAAIIALGAVLKWALPRWTAWVPVVACTLAGIVAIADIVDIKDAGGSEIVQGEGLGITVGIGLYVILLGAIVGAIGGWMLRKQD